jgi:hypothetical protein
MLQRLVGEGTIRSQREVRLESEYTDEPPVD